MEWLYPGNLWTLITVPLVALLFVWAAWQRREALRRFGDAPLVARLAAAVSPRRRRWKAALIALGVLMTALALAGPRFGTKLREVQREGVDLIIALDVSLSMQAEDVAPNRLERAKNEIKKLLGELRGDRVGLVLFAGDAFIQCPLTTDYSAVRLFLDVADPSLIPTPGTDFGVAVRQAIRAFSLQEERVGERTRVLLIVSDGENHVTDIDVVLDEAHRSNVAVFAAGVGETDGALIPVRQGSGRTVYKKDQDGQVVTTRLEEDALMALAENTAYYRIARTSSSLSDLAPDLSLLERTAFGAETFEEYQEQYQWPLALALLFLFGEQVFSHRRPTKVREDEGTRG